MPALARSLVLVALVLELAGLAWMAGSGRIPVPPRWNPWAPLDIAEPPGPFTGWKLTRLSRAPAAACYAWLDAAGVRHVPVDDRHETHDCGWTGATRLSGLGDARLASSAPLACPVVAALALWERHALQPAAFVQLGNRVQTIEHLGSYACRDIYGGRADRRSQHATANALDISGFRLQNGRRVTVLAGWRDPASPEQTPESRFLHEARTGACPFFSAVLGPAYNAAHRDHLHLDRGVYDICS